MRKDWTEWGKKSRVRLPCCIGGRRPESRKQDVKPFLGKVMVIREHIRQPFAAHGFHGDTVGEAVGFVQA